MQPLTSHRSVLGIKIEHSFPDEPKGVALQLIAFRLLPAVTPRA